MIEFNFRKTSSLQPAPVTKIHFAASIFQWLCLAFKNIFFKNSCYWLLLIKSVTCSLLGVIFWKGVLKIFRIFSRKHPHKCVILVKLHHSSIWITLNCFQKNINIVIIILTLSGRGIFTLKVECKFKLFYLTLLKHE